MLSALLAGGGRRSQPPEGETNATGIWAECGAGRERASSYCDLARTRACRPRVGRRALHLSVFWHGVWY